MLHRFALLLMVAGLAGCSSAPQQEASASDATCSGIATQRTQDAALNGYGADLQKAIWDRTYKDCLKSYRPVTVLQQKTK